MHDEPVHRDGQKNVRAVVFASEQTLPAMQFLLHVASTYRERLVMIGIFHTDDKIRSEEPAERLADLLEEWGGKSGLGFTVELFAGLMSPSSVREGLAAWFDSAPSDRWLVNVTGGTKLMSSAAGELTLRRRMPHARVLYLEISGAWFELSAAGADRYLDTRVLASATDQDVPPPDALDRLVSLRELVRTQFPVDVDVNDNELEVLPTYDVVQDLMLNGWMWKPAIDDRLSAKCLNNGDAFEKFVGSALLQCGIHRVSQSLKVLEASRSLAEMDLVACFRGRIVCLDLKLPNADEEARGVQLAKVATDARQIGGSAALAIAVRPGWDRQPTLEAQAAALRVKVLTQDEAPRLISHILALIDPTLRPSPDVSRFETLLGRYRRESGTSVLSDLRHLPLASEDKVLSLDAIVRKSAEFQSRPWALTAIGPHQYRLHVLLKSPQWNSPPDVRALRNAVLKAFGRWLASGQFRLVRQDVGVLVFDLDRTVELCADTIYTLVDTVCRSA